MTKLQIEVAAYFKSVRPDLSKSDKENITEKLSSTSCTNSRLLVNHTSDFFLLSSDKITTLFQAMFTDE